MKTRFLAVAMAAALISAPSQGKELEAGNPVELELAQRIAITSTDKEKITNPDEARFLKPSAARTDDGVVHVCGLVDVVDNTGTRTGFTPYMATLGDGLDGGYIVFVVAIADTKKRERLIPEVCRMRGIEF